MSLHFNRRKKHIFLHLRKIEKNANLNKLSHSTIMTDHWVPNRNFLVWIFAYKLLHICNSWRYEGSRGRNTESCKLYFPLSAGEKMKRAQDTVNYDKLQEK